MSRPEDHSGRRSVRRPAGRLVAAVVGLLVVMQFVPVRRENPPVRNDVGAPPEVAVVLRAACYDCHSRETRWPWYSRVAPVSWAIARHVDEGRRALDFSDWPALDFTAQDELLHDIVRQVDKEKMPLASYQWGHPESRLTPEQRKVITSWAKGS